MDQRIVLVGELPDPFDGGGISVFGDFASWAMVLEHTFAASTLLLLSARGISYVPKHQHWTSKVLS